MSARDGLCQCGCGWPTKVSTKTDAAKGWVAGEPRKFIQHHYANAASRGRPTIERLLPRLNYVDATGCIEYSGALGATGYGRIGVGARGEGMAYTHRVMFEWAKGPIPEGLVVDHLCRNKKCCNPSHLEAVTQAENNRRMWRDNRWTHCKRGHEFTSENTLHRQGFRLCRICDQFRRARGKAE